MTEKFSTLLTFAVSLCLYAGCSNTGAPAQAPADPSSEFVSDSENGSYSPEEQNQIPEETSTETPSGNYNGYETPSYSNSSQSVSNTPSYTNPSQGSGQSTYNPSSGSTAPSTPSSTTTNGLRPATSTRTYESAWDQMSPTASYQEFTDSRDGRIYRAITLQGLVWMAENVQYVTAGSDCPSYDDENCPVYGRLYTWDAASKACPPGWRIPSLAEWQTLKSYNISALKSSQAWNGNNATGFSALPSGRITCKGVSEGGDEWAGFWASTTRDGEHDRVHLQSSFVTGVSGSDYEYSVRCILAQ